MKIVKYLTLSIVCIYAPTLMAMSDYQNLDIAGLARKYLSSPTANENIESKQEIEGQEELEKKIQAKNQYSSTTTLNSLLTATPDSVKSAVLDKIPQEYKGYLVQFIEFIKSFFSSDKDKVTTLDSIKNALEKNIESSRTNNREQLPAQ